VLAAESLAMRPAFFDLAGRLYDEITARAPAIPRMQAFQRPVSVAFGADDPYLGLAMAADFAAQFPHARRVDLPAANHYVQLDRPADVARVILDEPVRE
jgi:pimeloyl-ACP methyl ester carboxylesterase